MKHHFLILSLFLFFSAPLFLKAQSCEDIALDFDGINDVVQLAPSPVPGNAPFTVEAKFQSTATGGPTSCSNNFKRLFSFIGTGRRIEVGECGGNPSIYWASSSSTGGPVSFGPNIRDGSCHHLALVYTGTNLVVYLDGVSVYNASIPGTFSPLSTFRAGQWGGGLAPNENWKGTIDEVRLWNVARTQAEIDANRTLRLTGTEPDLEAYWQMEDGIPAGNNTAISMVNDLTGNANHGAVINFSLMPGTTSNFVCAGCGDAFEVVIKDYATRSIDLEEICSGDPVHFCLAVGGNIPTASGSCYGVVWEYNDGAGWTPLPVSIYSGLCFPVGAGEITLDCATSTTGFLDRYYRATITTPAGCIYTSNEYLLRICCPLSPVSIALTPNTALCEGDNAQIAVSLNTPDLFVVTPAGQVNIEWTLPDGTMVSNQSTFNYQVNSASPPQLCFDVVVTNCAAKSVSASACITVDKQPVCGTITGMPVPANLIPDQTDPNLYYICPGDDAAVGVATPFLDCHKNWQYSFDQVTWTPLGISNNVQNTNILPSYYWPIGATSIYYRIECQPISSPSGCVPCNSNVVEIRLLTVPLPVNILGDNQICKGDFSTLTLSGSSSNLQYTWLWNGKIVGTGISYTATEAGCYWVEITNGCQVVETPQFCLEVCEIIPIISCPLAPNECAKLGMPITITASDSNYAEPSASCADNSNFTYTWTWTDGNGNPQTFSGHTLTDTPPASGTTYNLTILDPVSGCSASDQFTVVPCNF